jgi:methionyl-tRNA synthetase
MKPTFYLTTPIYYPNARPHVGSAYTTIVCDVLARYKRLCGYDVAFLTGTDEHGEKLQRAADDARMPVEQFVAEKRELFKDLWRTLGISDYRFVHTSQNPAHVEAVQWMIRQADKAGYIKKEKYEGRYCIYDERYVSDGPDPANCDICGRPAELISEENYFFRLSAFGGEDGRLMKLYREHPEFVQPDFRRNEVISFVKSGLRDISISRRRLKWGVPWPGDDDQVVYVWYDALTSYLTGLGFAGEKRSKDFEKYWMGAEGPAEVVHMIGKDILRFHAVYWPAFLMAANDALPETEKLPLPKTIFAHGWIYYEQDKMSKSKGNVVYPEPIVEAFDSFGAPGNDALRYYLLREAPFGQDTSFSYEALIQRYNSDLANDLGNLANRTITMLNNYFGGVVPPFIDVDWDPKDQDLRATFFGSVGHGAIAAELGLHHAVATDSEGVVGGSQKAFDRHDFSNGIALIWYGIHKVNTFLVVRQPWTLDSSAPLLSRTLYRAADLLRTIAVLIYPVMPESAERLWGQLGCEDSIADQRFGDLRWGGLTIGTKIGKPEPIFPRLDKAKALAKLEELAEADRRRSQPKGATIAVPSQEPSAVSTQPSAEGSPQSAVASQQSAGVSGQSTIDNRQSEMPSPEPRVPPAGRSPSAGADPSPAGQSAVTPTTDNQQSSTTKITIDDFAKVEMVVGQIVSAEPIPKAQKLLKLQVDIGTEIRQVCAGIAEFYKPEEVTGMKIVLVANLEPRKLRGVESNGMVVAASIGPEGRPVLATFKEDVPNGTRLK